MDETIPTPTNTEKIKLFKNTKGYNWEIQVLDLDIERLEQLNDEMVKRFGSQTDGSY